MIIDLGFYCFAQLASKLIYEEPSVLKAPISLMSSEEQDRNSYTALFLKTICKEIMDNRLIVLGKLKGCMKITYNLDNSKAQESFRTIFTKYLRNIDFSGCQHVLSNLQEIERQLEPEATSATCCTITADIAIFQINKTILGLLGKEQSKKMITEFFTCEILVGAKTSIAAKSVENSVNKMILRYFKK